MFELLKTLYAYDSKASMPVLEFERIRKEIRSNFDSLYEYKIRELLAEFIRLNELTIEEVSNFLSWFSNKLNINF